MEALLQHEQGGCQDIDFQGEHLILDCSACVFWPDEKTLMVADIHMEKGSSFASKGTFLPPYDTGESLIRLGAALNAWKPKRVISLGDSFHDDTGASRLSDSYVEMLESLMRGREWIWIGGNHDPSPPAGLGGLHSTELCAGPFVFRHQPVSGIATGEIAGHLHPSARIKRRGKSVRRNCFAGDGERLIVPAFGAYTGGLSLKHEAFEGLFDWNKLKAWMIGRETIFEIAGRQLVG